MGSQIQAFTWRTIKHGGGGNDTEMVFGHGQPRLRNLRVKICKKSVSLGVYIPTCGSVEEKLGIGMN
jgi:hypothetical protein